ncbi:MAG: hypothetical protein GY869_16240, partial [Planctomycetes bacterium]|nr:hypothetical protein [Planctomycetota bacterium]
TYPLNVDFNNEIRLLGYDLPTRRVAAGEGIPLVLYWQSLRRTVNSYIIFDRLLDIEQQSWGGYDRLPKETYPTNLWIPGEVVVDGFAVPVDPAAPDGIYNIVVGLYNEADPAAQSLPLSQAGQPLDTTSVVIGPLKVVGPPSDAVLSLPVATPQTSMSVELGDPPVIQLLGFDLIQEGEVLQLTLYWESLTQTSFDWSIFTHVRNQANETVAQKDMMAGSGFYPTSLWDSGEKIADNITIDITPELLNSEYNLVVGLYDLNTGIRLLVPDSANNEITLTTLEASR